MGINPRAHLCINWRLSLSNTNVLARQFVDHKRATEFASHKLGRPACFLSLPKGGWRLAILGLGDVAQPKPCRSPANGPRLTAQLATLESSLEHLSLVCPCWPTMRSRQEVRQVVELGRCWHRQRPMGARLVQGLCAHPVARLLLRVLVHDGLDVVEGQK